MTTTSNQRPRLCSHTSLSALAVALFFALLTSASLVVQAKDWKINFNEADINELVKFVADATNLTIVVDPKVKGKVKVISSQPVNDEELYDLFLSILDVHGFAAVRSGEVVRIVPKKNARSLPVPIEGGSGGEIVTHVIQLKNITAAKLIPILRPLVPQQAHMAAYAPSNAIIISDSAANIKRIRGVIAKVDQSSASSTTVTHLEHASADEVVRMLQALEKAEGAQDQSQARVNLTADKRTNSVLITGDATQRARVRELIKHLDAPLQTSGNARVIYLRYAKAVELAETLTKVVQNIDKIDNKNGAAAAGGQSSSTSIEADEATNSLIVSADAAVMSNIEAMIARLDIRRAQVLVEAIIVELEAIDNKDLGVQWVFADKDAGFGSSSNGDGLLTSVGASALDNNSDATTTVVDADSNTTTTTTNPDDSLLNLAGALASNVGQTLGVGKLREDGLSFAVIINALEQDTEANILSTPSLLTLDNSEATISVGQNVPFLTGSFTNASGDGVNNPFQTIERENVGITLKVTPHINEGDSVVLEIEQEVSSLTGASASDIITNERTISATVLARDNEVVVLGGLIKDDVQEVVRKVPVLGSIPLLGRLFRSTGTSVNKTNLYVFLRPTIIRDSETLSGATAEKYKYIRAQQLNRKLRGVDLVPDSALPLLPEWEEQLKRVRKDPEPQGNIINLDDVKERAQ